MIKILKLHQIPKRNQRQTENTPKSRKSFLFIIKTNHALGMNFIKSLSKSTSLYNSQLSLYLYVFKKRLTDCFYFLYKERQNT